MRVLSYPERFHGGEKGRALPRFFTLSALDIAVGRRDRGEGNAWLLVTLLPRIEASAPVRRSPSCHNPGALPGRSRPAALTTFPQRKRPAQVAGADVPSFVARWRGKFRAARRDDPRYEALARKDLQRSSWIPISSSTSPSTDERRPRNSTCMRRLPLITTVKPGQGRPLVRPHETRG